MPSVSTNRVDLYYEEHGAGAPVLFIHGMCGNANVWDDQVRRLSSDFRCLTYDRRGHTRSPAGPITQRTVELHADDAAGMIKTLGISPCHIVASSGGARVAVDVLRRYPGMIRRAALSEPPLLALSEDNGASFAAEIRPKIQAAMERGGPREAVDAFFEVVCPGLWSGLDDGRREPYRANHEELFGDLQMPLYQITTGDLRKIGVKSLILTGDESHPTLRTIAQALASNMPNAELLELRNCGHVTYAEQPENFAQAVRDFFSKSD